MLLSREPWCDDTEDLLSARTSVEPQTAVGESAERTRFIRIEQRQDIFLPVRCPPPPPPCAARTRCPLVHTLPLVAGDRRPSRGNGNRLCGGSWSQDAASLWC